MAVSEDHEVLQSAAPSGGSSRRCPKLDDAMLMQGTDSVGKTAPELAVLLRPADSGELAIDSQRIVGLFGLGCVRRPGHAGS
jgi:hypothetical protein